MREIKFRAYVKDIKKVLPVYSLNLTSLEDEPITIAGCGNLDCGLCLDFYSKESVELMQYTGLKDKKGEEIYEGDIVEITNHPFDRNEKEPCWNGKYIVRYYPETMELVFSKYTDANEGGWIAFRMRHYAEVIGNIYENPELIDC